MMKLKVNGVDLLLSVAIFWRLRLVEGSLTTRQEIRQELRVSHIVL